MEISKDFITKLKASATEVDLSGEEPANAIAVLVEAGGQGTLLKWRCQGEWLYSFQDENELYKRVLGMTKEDYENNKLKEKYDKNKFILAYAGRWKDEFKKHYSAEDFEQVDKLVTMHLNEFDKEESMTLYVSLAKVYYLLQGIEERPMYEIESQYKLGSTPQKRVEDPALYFLLRSNKTELYGHLIMEDFATVYGENEPEKIDKLIAQKSKEIEARLTRQPIQFGAN